MPVNGDPAVPYAAPADIWALGVVLYELHALGSVDQPYDDPLDGVAVTDAEVVTRVLDHTILPCPAACPAAVYKVMRKCWAFLPEQRPGAKELLSLLDVSA